MSTDGGNNPPARLRITSHTRSVGTGSLLDRLTGLLIKEGILELPALERARRAGGRTGERIDRALLNLGLVPEQTLISTLARLANVAVFSSADIPSEPLLPNEVHAAFVLNRKILPLSLDGGILRVATVDLLDDEPLRAISYLLDAPVEPVLIDHNQFDRIAVQLYGDGDGIEASELPSLSAEETAGDADVERLRDMANEAPVIRLVNEVIAEAVETGASDIHIEPAPEGVAIRLRRDGYLHQVRLLPPDLQAAVASRIKIVAKLDIAERRLPQDGRITLSVRGVPIDLRISTIPASYGESIVMRVLDRSRIKLNFETLGFSKTQIDAVSRLTRQPNGIFLVTGPTGSGKTTTLYTALAGINRPDTKIFTVEDPVEYQLAGVNQVQVQSTIGLDFPQTLRAILRQDPDIIMIGEIRDAETARIAIQASLTGHLVLSTVHTNSAAATVTRLIDMGIEPFLLASTLRGILAQRLVRRLCPQCRLPDPDAVLHENHISAALSASRPATPAAIKSAQGCPACHGSGYQGRMAVLELLPVDTVLQGMIAKGAQEDALEGYARDHGMTTLREDALARVWMGETTMAEVAGVTGFLS